VHSGTRLQHSDVSLLTPPDRSARLTSDLHDSCSPLTGSFPETLDHQMLARRPARSYGPVFPPSRQRRFRAHLPVLKSKKNLVSLISVRECSVPTPRGDRFRFGDSDRGRRLGHFVPLVISFLLLPQVNPSPDHLVFFFLVSQSLTSSRIDLGFALLALSRYLPLFCALEISSALVSSSPPHSESSCKVLNTRSSFPWKFFDFFFSRNRRPVGMLCFSPPRPPVHPRVRPVVLVVTPLTTPLIDPQDARSPFS